MGYNVEDKLIRNFILPGNYNNEAEEDERISFLVEWGNAKIYFKGFEREMNKIEDRESIESISKEPKEFSKYVLSQYEEKINNIKENSQEKNNLKDLSRKMIVQNYVDRLSNFDSQYIFLRYWFEAYNNNAEVLNVKDKDDDDYIVNYKDLVNEYIIENIGSETKTRANIPLTFYYIYIVRSIEDGDKSKTSEVPYRLVLEYKEEQGGGIYSYENIEEASGTMNKGTDENKYPYCYIGPKGSTSSGQSKEKLLKLVTIDSNKNKNMVCSSYKEIDLKKILGIEGINKKKEGYCNYMEYEARLARLSESKKEKESPKVKVQIKYFSEYAKIQYYDQKPKEQKPKNTPKKIKTNKKK